MSEKLYRSINRDKALQSLAPGRTYNWKGELFSGIDWTDGQDPPVITEEDLQAKIAEFDAEDEKNAWLPNRIAAYPDPMILNDAKVKQHSEDPDIRTEGLAQELKYYQDCLDVKELFPKPTE